MGKSFWDKEVFLKDVPKPGTKSTFYRLKEVEKNGKKYIDFREHFTRADGTEQFTSKGTAIPVEGIDDVISGLRDVKMYLEDGEMPNWDKVATND